MLAVSDVDDAATLGSGPTVVDATSPADALAVLDRWGNREAVPRSVVAHLGSVPPRDPPQARSIHGRVHVLADNDTALRAAAHAARALGYNVQLMPRWLRGEARERGRELAALGRVLHKTAVIAGGETTVRAVGHGKGGRNQELALSAVDTLSAHDAILAAFATDGVDGPTDAAGAIVDSLTRARADALGLDAHAALVENDAYPYFDALDDLIRTGPTGTNVRDLAVLIMR